MSERDYNPKNVRTPSGETRIREAEACFHRMYESDPNSDGRALALEQDLRVKLDGIAAMAGHLMRSLTSEGFSDEEALRIVIASLGECRETKEGKTQ